MGSKNISLKDIALTVSIAFVIVAISDKLAFLIQGFFSEENALSKIIGGFFGNKYLLITTFTMILSSTFSDKMEKIQGAQEIGTF